MDDAPIGTGTETGLPPGLRFLKALVIVLMLTLIGGVITVVAVIVTRMPTPSRPLPDLPAAISLPDGAAPRAITFGPGWTAVVTSQDRILVYGADGTLWQEVTIRPPQ